MDVLGVDVSKSKFDVALLRQDDYILVTFDNDSVGFVKLRKWLKKRKVNNLHACLEATGRYGDELALFLHEAGYQVSVVNPTRIQAYGASQLKRNKTDKEDAKVIQGHRPFLCYTFTQHGPQTQIHSLRETFRGAS